MNNETILTKEEYIILEVFKIIYPLIHGTESAKYAGEYAYHEAYALMVEMGLKERIN